MSQSLESLCAWATEKAKKSGSREVAVSVRKDRFIELQQRDGKLESVRESSSSGMSIDLYVDGRYSSHSTSDMRESALTSFIEEAVAMTRILEPDEHRHLIDPKYYEGRSKADLELYDREYENVGTDQRRKVVEAIESAARAVSGPILSVTAGYSDQHTEWYRVHSNGFSDGESGTQYWLSASSTVEDGTKKPEDYYAAGTRHLNDLPDPAMVGREASERALGRLGQTQLDSGTMRILVENRVGGRLLGQLLSAMSGGSLYQKQTFLAGKEGQSITADLLTIRDEPFLARGFGSSRFDGDGISRKRRTLIERGTLKTYLIGNYYGSKLGRDPTGGSTSNLVIAPGQRDLEAIVRATREGVLITGILGGNADPTTGDFSHGFKGFAIRDGKRGAPIGEMNITGSHKNLWNQLVEVGSDPYPYSSSKIPTLVFDKVSVSGA
jgi:PmbA protein